MAKYKQADRRRQIILFILLARRIDFCNRLRQRRTLGLRDLLQRAPERIFKADAGFVSANYNRAFSDSGFHGVTPIWFLRVSLAATKKDALVAGKNPTRAVARDDRRSVSRWFQNLGNALAADWSCGPSEQM